MILVLNPTKYRLPWRHVVKGRPGRATVGDSAGKPSTERRLAPKQRTKDPSKVMLLIDLRRRGLQR